MNAYWLDSAIYKQLDPEEKMALRSMETSTSNYLIRMLSQLSEEGIQSLKQLANVQEEVMKACRGVGKGKIPEIKKALAPWAGLPVEIIVSVRMLESERDAIYSKAKAAGLTPSRYLHKIIFEKS